MTTTIVIIFLIVYLGMILGMACVAPGVGVTMTRQDVGEPPSDIIRAVRP